MQARSPGEPRSTGPALNHVGDQRPHYRRELEGVPAVSRCDQHDWVTALAQLDGGGHSEDSGAGNQDAIHAAAHEVGSSFATFMTVSQVRVVTSFPNVFSMSVMNTGPRGPGT